MQQQCGPEGICHDAQCVACTPGQRFCQDNVVYECNLSGSGSQQVATCDVTVGETCSQGACLNACDQAVVQQSYIGCEYWPTTTANPALDGAFQDDFAVAVHNANSAPVTVTISLGGNQVAEQVVDGGTVATIPLPFVPELRMTVSAPQRSVLLPGSAYHPAPV